jgi:hypothetical protein
MERYWRYQEYSREDRDKAILWLVSGALFFCFTRLVRWIVMGKV